MYIAFQKIVCLPFRVVIKLVSEGLADIDDMVSKFNQCARGTSLICTLSFARS